MTERKGTEPLWTETTAQAKNAFLSNLSHDIRTPMNAIMGYTALARRDLGDSERVDNYLQKIETSSLQLLRLLDKLLDENAQHPGDFDAPEPGACSPMGVQCILLVDDNAFNREIATEILEDNGYQVVPAADGAEAVALLQRMDAKGIDMVLMDIQMPGMDGYETTEAIRALPDAWAKTLPIVALTANGPDSDQGRAKASGMNGYLSKPIDVPKLLDTLAMI
jgi:CheY-like chemotaxis protein